MANAQRDAERAKRRPDGDLGQKRCRQQTTGRLLPRHGLAPQVQRQYEHANGEFRQSGFLRDVNQDENFGDAVFSDGPLGWETQGEFNGQAQRAWGHVE